MSRADLDQTVGRLRNAVRVRLTNEETFKNQVYDRINTLLAGLNECAGAISSAPSADARSSAVGDLSRQIREITTEIGNLQRNPLAEADVDYVTGTLGTEALSDTLKWTSPAEKGAFRPPAYINGPGANVDPPPYSGDGSSRWPSGRSSVPSGSVPSGSASPFSFPSFPSFPSFSSRAEGVTPIVPVRGTNDPRYGRGGWSPRRPRRTPRQSPKKKTYRR